MNISPVYNAPTFGNTNKPNVNKQNAPVQFGSIKDDVIEKNRQRAEAEQLAVLNTDYGEGITGKEVLGLIVEFVQENKAQAKARYEQELAQYENRRGWTKLFSKAPERPTGGGGGSVNSHDLYTYFDFREWRRMQSFSPRLKAVYEALGALTDAGIIQPSYVREVYFCVDNVDNAEQLLEKANRADKSK